MDREPQHEQPIDWSDAADANRRHQRAKADYVTRLRQIGEEIAATPVAIQIIPPGVPFRPVVYQCHSDRSYLLLVGDKGEVAGDEDPEEQRAQARYSILGKTETIGDYVVKPYDLARALREQKGFYTPEGYLRSMPHDPHTDAPLIPDH